MLIFYSFTMKISEFLAFMYLMKLGCGSQIHSSGFTVHNNSKSPSTVGYLYKILLKIFATIENMDSFNIRHKSYHKMGKFCAEILV